MSVSSGGGKKGGGKKSGKKAAKRRQENAAVVVEDLEVSPPTEETINGVEAGGTEELLQALQEVAIHLGTASAGDADKGGLSIRDLVDARLVPSSTDNPEQHSESTALIADALEEARADESSLGSAQELMARITRAGERNHHVPMGLAGADTLKLRATENSHMLSRRGQGTQEQREEALRAHFSLGKNAGSDYKVDIDDSWEDETGLVRSRARHFVNKGEKHDPSQPVPGDGAYRPSLPLLYDTMGRPAKPTPAQGMTPEQFEAYKMEFLASLRDEKTGQYRLNIAEGLSLRCVEGPKWSKDKPYPRAVQAFIPSLLADETNSCFQIAPYATNNANSATKIQGQAIQGEYKFMRVTNMMDFEAPPKSHLTISWAEILGQHCSSFFETVEELRTDLPEEAAGGEDEEEDSGGAAAESTSGFEISFLRGMDCGGGLGDALEDKTDYCTTLIRARFQQFVEYLDRRPEHRECCMCKGPGADCVFLSMGDWDISGIEWEDPNCFCMVCRECVTHHMVRCDLSQDVTCQRCNNCRENYGGFQVHNQATKKLMLMQAATQVMLFFGPRKEGEPEETFEENMMRRACIQAVVEEGFKPALAIELGSNRAVEFRVNALDDMVSGGWRCWCAPSQDGASTGYDPASIQGRLLLRLCEAEAQLENFDAAATYAERSAELLSTLDRGRVASSSSNRDSARPAHPARQLIIPARQIAKRMRVQAQEARGNKMYLEDGKGKKDKKSKGKKGKSKGGKKKR